MNAVRLPRIINVTALRGAARSMRGLGLPDFEGSDYGDYSAGDSGGFDWGGLVGDLTGGATKILGQRYGVPQLNPGQYIRGANGQIMYQGIPGQPAPAGLNLTGGGAGGGMTTILLLVVGAFVVVMAVKGKG